MSTELALRQSSLPLNCAIIMKGFVPHSFSLRLLLFTQLCPQSSVNCINVVKQAHLAILAFRIILSVLLMYAFNSIISFL